MEPLEKITICGEAYSPCPKHSRIACRGILMREGNILLSYETNTDQWFLPGGGMEEKETPEECCIREMGEETGCRVSLLRPFVTVEEHYGDWLFVHRYFLCEQTGSMKRSPTPEEIENGQEPRWLSLDEAIAVFLQYQEYADTNQLKYGTYLREYTVLSRYREQCGN